MTERNIPEKTVDLISTGRRSAAGSKISEPSPNRSAAVWLISQSARRGGLKSALYFADGHRRADGVVDPARSIGLAVIGVGYDSGAVAAWWRRAIPPCRGS
jgi:hypothetical protein